MQIRWKYINQIKKNVTHNCSEKPIPFSEWFLHFGRKINKT